MYKIFLIKLIIITSILIFGISFDCLAYNNAEYVETFENYNIGQTLSSQSEWETSGGNPDFIVDNSNPYLGSKNIIATTSSQTTIFDYPNAEWSFEETRMEISFWYYFNVTTNGSICYAIHDEFYIISNRCLVASGWTGEGGIDFVTSGRANAWHNVSIKINCENDLVNFYDDGNLIETVDTFNVCDNLDKITLYTGGVNDATTTIDNFIFQPTELETITIFDDPLDYDLGLDMPEKKFCYFDEECNLSFWYDTSLIGYKAYLVPNIDDLRNIENSISSTTLQHNIFLEGFLSLPIKSEATTTEYCIYLDTIDPIVYCYTIVDYIDQNLLPDFDEYDIESACDDMEEPDPQDYFEEVAYGVECGFRKFAYWLIVPKPKAYENLDLAITRMKSAFPFSIYNQINETIIDTLSATSTNISIPLFWNGEIIEGVNLLDENTMSDGIGDEAWNIIDNSINKLIYFFGFIYFIYRIFKLSHKK